jgi:hypothetical protein
MHHTNVITTTSAISGIAVALQILFGSLIFGNPPLTSTPQQRLSVILGLVFSAITFVMLIAAWSLVPKMPMHAKCLLEITLIPLLISVLLFFLAIQAANLASISRFDGYVIAAGILGLIAFITIVAEVFTMRKMLMSAGGAKVAVALESLAAKRSTSKSKSPSRGRSRS